MYVFHYVRAHYHVSVFFFNKTCNELGIIK